jgi:hypothetical protein
MVKYTVVIYRRPKKSRLIVYSKGAVASLKVSSGVQPKGQVKKTWTLGRVKAYLMRVKAKDIAPILRGRQEVCTKAIFFDQLFREAVAEGYRIHENEYFVQLWLSKPLGNAIGRVDEIDLAKLKGCLGRCFSWSYGELTITTPPWCCEC